MIRSSVGRCWTRWTTSLASPADSWIWRVRIRVPCISRWSRLDVAAVVGSAVRRSERTQGNRLASQGKRLLAAADPIALEAVLDAVLENVAQHGGGSADLTWRREDGHVVLSVVDHGPGIPAELHGRAFDRFFRADPSRTRDTGGAGLGLALARALIEAQEGRMWLEPTPGGGLTVSVALSEA